MEAKQIQDKINELLKEKNYLDEHELENDANLRHDLGIDSLDKVEILMDVEKLFEIHISDQSWEECKTLGDVYLLVEAIVNQ